MDSTKCLLTFLLCLIFFEDVKCAGTMLIKFNRYLNPGGLGANGHCCDGRGPFCLSACDHMFYICIDHPSGDAKSRCAIARKETEKIINQDSITFSTSIGGLTNPMEIPFDKWHGGFSIRVEVWDSDAGVTDREYVDTIFNTIYMNASRHVAVATPKDIVISSRTKMSLTVKVYCDFHNYGENCQWYCKGQDNENGHYFCDPDNGKKICLLGWSGEDCNLPVDECASSPCLNGGHCIDEHNNYRCKCPKGVNGDHCEINIDDCPKNKCKNNAKCIDHLNRYECFCTDGWDGPFCDHRVNPCFSNPCQNNGTCIDIGYPSYNCTCLKEFAGPSCEYPADVWNKVHPYFSEPNDVRIRQRGHILIPIMVEDELDEKDEMKIDTWLLGAVDRTISIPHDLVQIGVAMSPCFSDKGEPVTDLYIEIIILEGSNHTDEEIRRSIKIVNKDVHFNFPYKQYKGNCNMGYIGAQKEAVGSAGGPGWLIPVIAICFIIAITFFIILAVILYKRKRKSPPSTPESPIQNFAFMNSKSPKAYAVDDGQPAFSNALYLQPNAIERQFSGEPLIRDDDDDDGIYSSID